MDIFFENSGFIKREKDNQFKLTFLMQPKRSGSLIKKVIGASICMLGFSALQVDAASINCYDGQRFPKAVQGTVEAKNSYAGAVTVYDAEAVFSAGFLDSKDFDHPDSSLDKWVHVGRINLSNNMWAWHKTIQQAGKLIRDVRGLAVDSTGQNLAVYAPDEKEETAWVFVLDTVTGRPRSKVLQLAHGSDQFYRASSQGLIIEGNFVYMALDHTGQASKMANSYQQRLRIAAFDWASSSVAYVKEQSSGYGHSSTLALANGHLYLGGSYDANGSSLWGLSIVRIAEGAAGADSAQLSRLDYVDDKNKAYCQGNIGFSDVKTALYINNLQYSHGCNMLFGTTATHNHDGNRQGQDAIIFRAVVDSNGDVSTNSGDFRPIKVGDMGNEWRFFGLYYGLSQCKYLFTMIADERNSELYMLRADISDTSYNDWTMHKISYSTSFTTYSAFFAKGLWGAADLGASNSFAAPKAFIAGMTKQYDTRQQGSVESVNGKDSYVVWTSHEEGYNCVNQDSADVSIRNEEYDGCSQVTVSSFTFADVPDSAVGVIRTIDTTVEIYDMDISTMFYQELCNNGDATDQIVLQPTLGTAKTDVCFTHGASVAESFNPSLIQDNGSDLCVDPVLIYKAIATVTPFPIDIDISIDASDQTDPKVIVSHAYGQAPGTGTFGIYPVEIWGYLQDQDRSSNLAASFDLILHACSTVSLLTPSTSYSYTLGDPSFDIDLDMSLSDVGCTLSIDTPTVSPADTNSIFIFSNNNERTTVGSLSDLGEGTYTITLATVGNTCVPSVSVSFDVVVINPCLTTSITIDGDSSVFLSNTATVVLDYVVMVDTTKQLQWDNTNDIVSTQGTSTLCGSIVQEVVETSGSPLDPTLFTASLTGANSNLQVSTTDSALAGLHYLMLKAYHANYQVETESTRDFIIEVKLPCESTVLSIDDTVIRTTPTVSQTQYVNYSTVQLAWSNDSIIQSSIAVGAICGAYTYELQDITTGTPSPIDANVFPLTDFVSTNKFIDIQSTNIALAQQYTLELKVYFTSYPSGPSTTKNFLVDLIDYCDPSATITTTNTDLTYTLGRVAESNSFSAWTPTPTVCNLFYSMTVLTPTATNPGGGMINFDGLTRTLSVSGSEVFYSGDGTYTPGVYTVEIRAFGDNSFDTGTAHTVTVTILDPCDPDVTGTNVPNVTILSTIVTPNPIPYTILDPVSSHVLIPAQVTQSESIITCPPILFEVTNTDYTPTLDASLFTWTSATQTLDIQSTDMADLATLTRDLRIAAYYDGGSHKTYSISGYLDIQIVLSSACDTPNSVTAPTSVTLADYFYTGSTSAVQFTVGVNDFTVDPIECQPEFAYTCSHTGPSTDICAINEDGGLTVGAFDPLLRDYSLQTTNISRLVPGVYVISITGTVGTVSAASTFTVELKDPCPLSAQIAITTEIFSGPISHTFRDSQVTFPWNFNQFDVTGVSVDGNCGNKAISFFYDDGLDTPFDTVLFEDDRSGSEQFIVKYIDDPTKDGVYSITYEVSLVGYPSITARSVAPMTVTVIDPCTSSTAIITPSVLIDQTQTIYAPSKTYAITPFTIQASWCPHTYTAQSSDPHLDSQLFSFDDTTQTFTILSITDPLLAGFPAASKVYTITVTVQVDGIVATADFDLTVLDPCNDPLQVSILQPLGPFQDLSYIVGSQAAQFDFNTIAGGSFTTTNPICDDGGIYFTANLLLESGDLVPLTLDEGAIVFADDGRFAVFTSDNQLIGEHEIQIEANLVDYSNIKSTTVMTVPIAFVRCEILVQEWDMVDIVLPYEEGTLFRIEEPRVKYLNAVCPYPWESFTVTIYDTQGIDVTAVTSDIIFDETTKMLTLEARSDKFYSEVRIEVYAQLSNNLTSTQAYFVVEYEGAPIVLAANTAPIFLGVTQDMYVRTKSLVTNSTVTTIDSVILGSTYDAEGDVITQSFKCITCSSDNDITYNESKGEITISPEVAEGYYRIEITLADNNEDQQSKRYSFDIRVKEPVVFTQIELAEQEAEVKVWVNPDDEKVLQDKEEPGFELLAISYIGLLEVGFSQDMIKPSNMTEIDDSIFELELLPDQTNEVDDPSKLDFTWSVISFGKRTMQVQIDFSEPVYISAGEMRDKLRATVRDPVFFQSSDSFLTIPMNATDTIKVVKQMPNTEFTKVFTQFNAGMGNLTNGALIGNFLFNLLLSGAMNLLWGLLHAMQIVAHFPLINIMMPPNASMLFQVIVQIATFDMIPTEDFVQAGEETVGLKSREYLISDSFGDYGFDSTDPIRNLQVMFLFLVFLITYPALSYVARGICCCSRRCKRCMDKLENGMYFNTYIRFGLEAYLELQLTIMIRYKNVSFDGADQIFHSVFCAILLLGSWGLMIYAAAIVLCKCKILEDSQSKKRIVDLHLGLNPKSSYALFHPVLFMLRRIAYAGICVFWFERSYFQVQFLIFKQSLFMVYQGQFNPMELPSQNTLELINEFLTLLCSYSLIMFSAFVPDAATRFLCGWQLIGLVLVILAINLFVIGFTTAKQSIRRCKLKCIRKANIRAYKKRQAYLQRVHKRIELAKEAAAEDQFYKLGGFQPLESLVDGQTHSVELRMHRTPDKHHLYDVTPLTHQNQLSAISEEPSEESKGTRTPRLATMSLQDQLQSMSEDENNMTTSQGHSPFIDPVAEAWKALKKFNIDPNHASNSVLVKNQMTNLRPMIKMERSGWPYSSNSKQMQKYPMQ